MRGVVCLDTAEQKTSWIGDLCVSMPVCGNESERRVSGLYLYSDGRGIRGYT